MSGQFNLGPIICNINMNIQISKIDIKLILSFDWLLVILGSLWQGFIYMTIKCSKAGWMDFDALPK